MILPFGGGNQPPPHVGGYKSTITIKRRVGIKIKIRWKSKKRGRDSALGLGVES